MARPTGDTDKTMRSVFVGNIPYEATEEQLKEIFQQVGPVLSFRIVYDRETGKPKGYGFCEYQDLETAQSAMRNLNDFDFHGRTLRVGHAAGEQSNADKVQAMAAQGPPEEEIYGVRTDPDKAPEAISKAVASLPPEQMFELMKQMKLCIQNNPNEARNMLLQNPQLAYALLQAQIVMKIVDPQVALAMLHRQSEEIPPLVPTSVSAPPATSIAAAVTAPPVAPPPEQPNPHQGGILPTPQPQPVQQQQGLQQRSPMDVDVDMRTGPSAGPPRGGLLGDRPPPPTSSPYHEPRMPPSRNSDPYLDRRGEPDRYEGPPDRYGGPMRAGPRDGPPPRGYEGRGPPYGGPPPNDRYPGRGDPRGEPRPDQRGGDPRGADQRVGDPRGADQRGGDPRGGDPRGGDPRGEPRLPPPDPRDPRSQRMPPTGGPGPRPGAPPRQPPPGSDPRSVPAPGAASGAQDQEKAALIMQVLQLTDEQIAMLPPEQRNSILILKEQIARSTSSG